MNDRLRGLLGLCARSGQVISGDPLWQTLASGQIYLLLVATDASLRTRTQLEKKAYYYEIPLRIVASGMELSRAIGKDNRMVLGITDQGFAKAMLAQIPDVAEMKEDDA